MTKDHILWFGRHEGWLRHLSHGVRGGDAQCIDLAARLFDLMLPDDCVVVPMPSHEGNSTYMYRVASKVCHRNRRIFYDCLQCSPHESNYDQKKRGEEPRDFQMWVVRSMDCGDIPWYIIDNTIGTGMTATKALAACGKPSNTFVCALSRGL